MIVGGAHSFGVDVAFFVLPTVLQDKHNLSRVIAIEFDSAEGGALHQFARIRDHRPVVEHHSLGAFRKGDAPVHESVRVADAGDGFQHLAPINRAGRQHLDVHHAGHLTVGVLRGELGATSRRATVGGDVGAGLCDSHHLGKGVGSGPNRFLVVVGIIADDSVRRANDIKGFAVAANDLRLVDITHHPLLEVAKRHLLVALCEGR